MTKAFYGRERELKLLTDLTRKKSPSLVVIRGRRRIGKSRLVQEFGKSLHFLSLEGIPPDKRVTATVQREDFAGQLQRVLGIPKPRGDDWADLFWVLAEHTKSGPVCILLDEINWMGDRDPAFWAS